MITASPIQAPGLHSLRPSSRYPGLEPALLFRFTPAPMRSRCRPHPAASLFFVFLALGSAALAGAAEAAGPPGDPVANALSTLASVGPEGEGNEEAAAAWKIIAAAGASQLPQLLAALDQGNPLSANWIASAAEAIASRERTAGRPLPIATLGDILLDTSRSPHARRLAFDLIHSVEPDAANQLIPGFLNDPAVELRRPAVQGLIDEASRQQTAGQPGPAALLFRQALQSARDVDQIELIAERLGVLGQEVDLPRHFGFLTEWKVIGPFHNQDRSGFDAAFPPEEGISLDVSLPGKEGAVQWIDYRTTDRHGMVDLNQPLGMLKEVTGYAWTEFISDSTQPAELRLGSKNAWKVWLNGELLFGRDEYHRGIRIDQYRMPCQLREGRNEILVKLCQNEQVEDWTVEWQFQLRVCDASGTAILSTGRPATPEETRRPVRASSS
ncbi:MAG TPA: hypothetical protein VMN36_05180 [Verrucomicrobiales bacterium]|nr:hypothetical protein [Verrucomicrobiales bacterium]